MEKQQTRTAALQAKAAAAAKLVLQDLDPAAKRRRQLFSSGPPQGILAIHAKTLRNFSKTFFFTSTFSACTEIKLYLKIGIQDIVKCSKIVQVRKDTGAQKSKLVLGKQNKLWSKKSLSPQDARGRQSSPSFSGHRDSLAGGNPEITIDELKIFPLDLCTKRDSPKNQVTLELMEVEGTRTRSTLNVGNASLHLFNLIREMYGTKSIPLMVKDKKIADLEYEYVFRYGTFGFGYSHQLQQNETPINQVMNESLFFKLDPLPERMDDDGLLAPTRVNPPQCINDFPDDEESSNFRNKAVSSSLDMFSQIDTANLDNLIEKRHRLSKLKEEYSKLKTRHDRNSYLERVLAKSGAPFSDQQSEDGDGEADDSPRSMIGAHLDPHRQTEAVKAVIENLSPLLLMAPGLLDRKDTRRTHSRPSMRPRDSRLDDPTTDPIERLRALYDNNAGGGADESESERPKSAKSSSVQESNVKQRGFLGILKKKVLAPMKFGKILGNIKDTSGNLSDAEEGNSSAGATSDEESPRIAHMSDLVQRMNKVSPSESPSSSPRRSLTLWRRLKTAKPTVLVTEHEDSRKPPSPPPDND